MYVQETWAADAGMGGGQQSNDHYHDDDKHERQLSLILKRLYTALNTKMDTNLKQKREEVLVL